MSVDIRYRTLIKRVRMSKMAAEEFTPVLNDVFCGLAPPMNFRRPATTTDPSLFVINVDPSENTYTGTLAKYLSSIVSVSALMGS